MAFAHEMVMHVQPQERGHKRGAGKESLSWRDKSLHASAAAWPAGGRRQREKQTKCLSWGQAGTEAKVCGDLFDSLECH